LPADDQTLAEMPPDAAEQVQRWVDTNDVLEDFAQERRAQFQQWGEQTIPFGTGDFIFGMMSDNYRAVCQDRTAEGTVTWADVLLEEVFEALAELDPLKLKDELIQVGAVVTAIIERINKQQREATDATVG
jgi:hypothetical protein